MVDLSKQMHSAPDHPKAKFRKSAVGGCSWKLHVNIKNRSSTFTVLKGEKYKRPLLMRQENHRLKMLTVTFQKAQSLSNSENTRRGRKKKRFPNFEKEENDQMSVLFENFILQGYFSSHFLNGDLQGEHKVPLVKHFPENL